MDKYVEYCAHDERHHKIKLIIEIEKDYYEIIKYDVEHGHNYKYFEIIANGIPYNENTNGDSISREALKEKLKERYYNDGLDIVTAIELLDNAPSVEIATELQPNCNKLQQKEDCGKWIIHDRENLKYGCNQCGNLANIPSNFCPNCGKRMKKGAEI